MWVTTMGLLKYTVYGIVALMIIYLILKIIASKNEDNSPVQAIRIKPRPRPKQIEIVSRDLYVRAENLLNTSEVYGLQAEQLRRQINDIEDALQKERASMIRDDRTIKEYIAKSLRLQERKCQLESKMIKINKELDDIAKEEYRRQTNM